MISELDEKCPFCKVNLEEYDEQIKNTLNQTEKKEEKEMAQKSANGRLIGLIIFAVIIFIVFKIFTGVWDCLGNNTNTNNKKPDNIELMSYAQMVLKDNLYNPKYSSYKEDYKFIQTGLRYKIEGKVNGEEFWMIIEFVDESYKEYDLISLQVGNEKIH